MIDMKTEAQWTEALKIKRHGEQMKAARQMYGTHVICPDCYAPPPYCKHDLPYDRRKNNGKR